MPVDATPNSANEKQINMQASLVSLDFWIVVVVVILVLGPVVLFAELDYMCFHG